MKASVATVKLNSVNLNSVRMNMVELGRKTSRQSTLPAPVAWYDIEKEGKNNESYNRSVISDFSGNGRHLNAYAFAWGGMSGYGGYPVWWSKAWADRSPIYPVDKYLVSRYKLRIQEIREEQKNQKILIAYQTASFATYDYYINIPTHRISIKGLPDGVKFIVNIFFDNTKDNLYGYKKDENLITITKDGIYEIPKYSKSVKGAEQYRYILVSPIAGNCDISIETLPQYPGALVFDSSDDYAEFVGDLGLNEYTVLFDRLYYNSYKTSRYPLYATLKKEYSKNDIPFKMEFIERNGNDYLSYSYGASTEIDTINGIRKVSVQTSVSYNGKDILRGDSLKKGNGLCLGHSSYLVFYKLLLFDRILTAEQIELAKVKYGFNK